MKSEPLFNRRKRRVNRSRIPHHEPVTSLIIIGGLIAALCWVFLQRENYNPEDRDLPIAYLETGLVTAEIHKTPLQRWQATTGQEVPIKQNFGLLSEQILNEHWKISVPLREFNADTLFEKINGEADKFLQQGFKNLQFIRIEDADGSNEIGIELYDQGELKGSLGVFAEYVATHTKIQTHDNVVYILNTAGAVGRKGRYFIRLIGNRESQAIVAKSEAVLKSLVSLPETAADLPFAYQILAGKLGFNPALIRFQSRNVFQFDFARDFWFGAPDPEQAGRLFIHRAASEEAARTLTSKLVKEQAFDYEIQKNTPGFAIMRHLYLKTWFVVRQEGPVVFGVEKMADVQMAQRLIRQTSDILANDSEFDRL